jgi:hypothetical protein
MASSAYLEVAPCPRCNADEWEPGHVSRPAWSCDGGPEEAPSGDCGKWGACDVCEAIDWTPAELETLEATCSECPMDYPEQERGEDE